MNFKINISNKKLIFALAIFLAILVGSLMYWEIDRNGDDVENIVKEDALTLIETLSQSVQNALITNDEFESFLINRLNTAAALLDQLKSRNYYSEDGLDKTLSEFNVDLCCVVNDRLNMDYTNLDSFNLQKYHLESLVTEFLKSSDKTFDLGYVGENQYQKDYYLFFRKKNSGNGVIITGFHAQRLIDFRKKIGIGKKIKDLAKSPNVAYALIQDPDGLIAASDNIKAVNAIDGDDFLNDIWKNGGKATRITEFEGENVLEAIELINTPNIKAINRIGVKMTGALKVEMDSTYRTILLGVGIYGLTALFFVLYTNRNKMFGLEEERRKSAAYALSLLNGMAEPVVVIDSDDKIQVFNPAAENFFNLSTDKVLGLSYTQVFTKDELSLIEFKEKHKALSFKDKTTSAPNFLNKVFDLTLTSIDNSSGEAESIVCVLHDLTALKEMQTALSRKDRMTAMGELAAAVAHEIRNPLNAIGVIAQRFLYEFEPNEDSETYFKLAKTVLSETERVNNIIKQFLDFARPRQLHLLPGDINSVVLAIINLVKSECEAKKIALHFDVKPVARINYDSDILLQAILNLVKNAIEAIQESGNIWINITENDTSIILKIKDDGPGIPEKILSKIFNLYFTTKSGGSGLGLSIVHKIINEHGAELKVSSEENQFTCFEIIFPVAK